PTHIYTLSLHDALPISMTISTRRVAPVTVRPASLADAADVASCLAELGYGTPVEVVTEKLVAVAASEADAVFVATDAESATVLRSEEHTSELQSRGHLV